MRIEYKDIIINSGNIQQYRQGIVGGRYCSEWDLVNNRRSGDGTVIVYNYLIDADLNIPSWDPLRVAIDKMRSGRAHIIAHETRHAHNELIGLPFHLAGAMAYPFMCLRVADEFSARTAEGLSRISGTFMRALETRLLGVVGKSRYDRAVSDALDRFEKVFPHYCQKYMDEYYNCWDCFNFAPGQQTSIQQSQALLYKYDVKQLQSILKTLGLQDAVKYYLTFDGADIREKLNGAVLKRAKAIGAYFDAELLKCARQCVNNLGTR